MHTFEHTDNGHEKEEKDDGQPIWNTLPHGSLSIEKGVQSYCEGKEKNGGRNQDASPEKDFLCGVSRGLLRFERLASSPSEEHLNGVAAMQEA